MMNGNKIIYSPAAGTRSFTAVRRYLELLKIHLCIYISLSAVFGHVMAVQHFSAQAFIIGMLVFILACGSAVWNNIQDRAYDLSFSRTRLRVLPQKKIPVLSAAFMGTVMIGLGLTGLLVLQNNMAFFTGVLAVFCYNLLYTPLKKKTIAAIIPGSVSGMLPPLIGWTAAGNAFMSKGILLIMIIFGLWQIPHFFVIVLKNLSAAKEAAENNLPCFSRMFTRRELCLQTLIWTSLYSLSICLFLLSGSILHWFFISAIFVDAVVILIIFAIVMLRKERINLTPAFAAINLSILLFMAAGIGDKLVG